MNDDTTTGRAKKFARCWRWLRQKRSERKESERVMHHVRTCPQCSAELEQWQALVSRPSPVADAATFTGPRAASVRESRGENRR